MTSRHVRIALCAVVLLAAAISTSHAQQAVTDKLDAFLADTQLPPGLKAQRGAYRTTTTGAREYTIQAPGTRAPGSIAVMPATGEVVSFGSAPPTFPVPDARLTPEQATSEANQFARKYRPELFAAGEVAVQIDASLSPRGGYPIRLRQKLDGTETLAWADIEVRVYDGKIVGWACGSKPVTVPTGATVSLEQAKQAAEAKMPFDKYAPVLWLETANRVVEDAKGQQSNVWELWAEIQNITVKRKESLQYLGHWWIDAREGTVLKSEGVEPHGELIRWYYSKGGTHVPSNGPLPPARLFTDRAPAWSPDGKVIAFQSTRARPGYPEYLARPFGLFTVAVTGAGLRCIWPGEARAFCWSPNGQRIAIVVPEGAIVLTDAAGKEQATLTPAAKGDAFTKVVWANDDCLVAGYTTRGFQSRICTVRPSAPTTAPVELPAPLGQSALLDAALSADGKTLAMFTSDQMRWLLSTLPADDLTAAPTTVTAEMRGGNAIAWTGPQSFIVGTVNYETLLVAAYYCAPGEPGKWTPWFIPNNPMDPLIKRPRSVSAGWVAFSPDQQQIVTASEVWDYDMSHRPAAILYLVGADGSKPTRLTPWGGDQPAATK